jgi:hypothetical protein
VRRFLHRLLGPCPDTKTVVMQIDPKIVADQVDKILGARLAIAAKGRRVT